MSEPADVRSHSGPSMKRKRDDMGDISEIANENAITRSDIWFDDGNIVLQAQATQFRVHKGIIARHSSVFKDMLAMPQPSGEPEVDGCAIVHLVDQPQDWQNILTLLYDGSSKAYKSTNTIPFSMLESMLRLGKKYEFDHLRALGVEYLRTQLPQTLDLWEKKYNGDSFTRTPAIECHPFDLINLVLEAGIRSVLPTALYACIEIYPLGDILRGSAREDGTPVHLAPTTQTLMVLGWENLSRSSLKFLQEWFNAGDVDGCSDPTECRGYRARILRVLLTIWHPDIVVAPILLKKMRADATHCEICKATIVDKIQNGRAKEWDQLPKHFGLPKWADIDESEN